MPTIAGASPAYLGVNDFNGLYDVQNQSQFSKLSVYFALNQVQNLPQKEVFGMLYGTKPWQPNMGTTMQGIRLEPTPKLRSFFRPQAITARAYKDVLDQRENQERATLFWHKFESPLIYWLRNFQDFISDQIRPAMADMNEQIVYNNERFIETQMWDRAPGVYIAGDVTNGPLNTNAPHCGAPGYATNPKADNWVAANLVNVRSGLNLATVHNALLALKEDLGATPFSGSASGVGKDNDLLQGQFVLLTSSEAYSQFVWDTEFQRLRDTSGNYVNTKFTGGLFGQILVKGLQKPIRFKADGTTVDPEILVEESGETIPNPNYVSLTNAPYEMAWLLGSDVANTIKIGPPPKEFAGGASAKQVNGMNWNGKVSLTDNVLIKSTDSAGTTVYETNAYKEYLRLQATLTMGYLPARPRNGLPILFRRQRTSEVTA